MSEERRRVTKKPQTIKAWSYSRYQTWSACPHKARVLYLGLPGAARVQLPASKAMARGSDAHEQAERYLRGGEYPEHAAWEGWDDELAVLLDMGYDAESRVAFTEEGALVDWFDADVWLRMIFDAMLSAEAMLMVIDYKTGRERAEHEDQAGLYAMGAWWWAQHNECYCDAVTVDYWYLDSGEIVSRVFDAGALEREEKRWRERGAKLTSDAVLAPTPGLACRAYGGCPLAADKLGHCEFTA